MYDAAKARVGVAEETGRGAAFGGRSGARKRRTDCDPAESIADQRGPASRSHGPERKGRRAACLYGKSTRRSTALSTCAAVRIGEVVSPGQTIVTLIRSRRSVGARRRRGNLYRTAFASAIKLTVRLPSGEERQGSVFFRGVDANFATQRDVSRTKRDIKTFEIRLRVDNHDRRLAFGMTAYVLLPVRRG